ncbi:MAG: V-type ATP synthase subunit F [Candidatus Micrarchaeota archaeon]
MEKIAVLADSESLVGFKLAGITQAFECTRDNADERVNEVLEKHGIGLVILTRDLLDSLSAKTLKRVEDSTNPVVLTIPSKGAALGEGGEGLAEMVKRAIGVDLSKK